MTKYKARVNNIKMKPANQVNLDTKGQSSIGLIIQSSGL